MRKVINGEIHYYIVQGDCITECDRETSLVYYREVWRTNYNRMHRQGLCSARSAYVCRGDCIECCYRIEPLESLEYQIQRGYEPVQYESIAEQVEKKLLVEAILAKVRESIENGDVILQMKADEHTIAEIAENLGITMSMVYRRIQKIRELATKVAEDFEKNS